MNEAPIPQLREYQEDLTEETRSHMRKGIKSILIQSPTGSGKTLLTAHMLKKAESKKLSAWFIVHRRELIKQSILSFAEVKVNHGVVASGWNEAKRLPIQIASIQTLINRMDRFIEPSLIIWDECHHCAAGSWKKVRDRFPNAFHIGLTATPQRLDGKGLKDFFSVMVNGPTVEWLIENGYLCAYRLFAPSKLNMSDVHTRMGDYVKSETLAKIDKPRITGDAIRHYQSLCHGKRAVVFCVSVEHSKHVVKQFTEAGITAAHVDADTDKTERDRILRRFKDGEIKVVSNVDLFGEGFDLPSLEVAILLRPTKSLGLYLQQVGRALRTSPGKKLAIILDHAGNCERHGLPCDDREWSLEGSKGQKKGQESGVKVKTCPKCYAVQGIGRPYCSYCHYVYEAQGREVDHVDGTLVEVDAVAIRRERLQEQGKCKTREELLELAKQRGYKNPHGWVHIILQQRQRRKMAGKNA